MTTLLKTPKKPAKEVPWRYREKVDLLISFANPQDSPVSYHDAVYRTDIDSVTIDEGHTVTILMKRQIKGMRITRAHNTE